MKRLLLLFLILFSFRAFAATKSINKVSVKINSKLEPGLKIPKSIYIDETPGDGQIAVYTDNSAYEIKEASWITDTSDILKAGDTPEMELRLVSKDINQYYFLTSYRSSNVSVTNGTFVTAVRMGDDLKLRIKLKNVSGSFDGPVNVYWNDANLGEIRWDKPDNTSGYYEAKLVKDQTTVVTRPVNAAISFDFYPWMEKSGSYYVYVRTVPYTDDQKKYTKASSWVSSPALVITDRDASDGTGKTSGNAEPLVTYGWYRTDGKWHYRDLNGNNPSTGWSFIDRKWYYFDENLNMVTGWITIEGKRYFFPESGEMYQGWLRDKENWYYFAPEGDLMEGENMGQMVQGGLRFIDGHYYYFEEDGRMFTGLKEFPDGERYFNEADNSTMGMMITGWIKRNGHTYYYDSQGLRAEGLKEIDGFEYYFYPGSGELK